MEAWPRIRREAVAFAQYGAFALLVVVAAAALAMALTGCGPERAIPSPGAAIVTVPDPDAALARAEAEKRAAQAQEEAAKARAEAAVAQAEADAQVQKAQNEVKLGKEAAKASLADAAGKVGTGAWIIGGLSLVGLVAGAFFGGIGRAGCLTGMAIAAGLVWLKFFIIEHGYFVSESISWGLIIGGGVALAAVTVWIVQRAYATWNAHGLLAKRDAQGKDPVDAFALLPVSKSVKAQLHDAWTYLTDPKPGDSLVESQAAKLLARFGIAPPQPPPATAA